MRKLNRSVARAYAREMGIQHMNKRRVEAKTVQLHGMQRVFNVRAKSIFGDFYARLMTGTLPGAVRKSIKRYDKALDKRAAEARESISNSAARLRLNDRKAAQFPRACGAR